MIISTQVRTPNYNMASTRMCNYNIHIKIKIYPVSNRKSSDSDVSV